MTQGCHLTKCPKEKGHAPTVTGDSSDTGVTAEIALCYAVHLAVPGTLHLTDSIVVSFHGSPETHGTVPSCDTMMAPRSGELRPSTDAHLQETTAVRKAYGCRSTVLQPRTNWAAVVAPLETAGLSCLPGPTLMVTTTC